ELTVLKVHIQSALVIRTTFVPLCFSEKNVLITSEAYECSYNQRNYLVFWKSVLRVHVLITRFLYDVLITRVLITRVDCTSSDREQRRSTAHEIERTEVSSKQRRACLPYKSLSDKRFILCTLLKNVTKECPRNWHRIHQSPWRAARHYPAHYVVQESKADFIDRWDLLFAFSVQL